MKVSVAVCALAVLFPMALGAVDTWVLPTENMTLKPGGGREVVLGQCLVCHSVDYITTQPPLSRAEWQASVEKMRAKYGAAVPTNALPVLVDYLARNYGRPEAKP